MDVTGRLSTKEFWQHMSQIESRVLSEFRQVRVFGLREWVGPIMIGDWEWMDNQLSSAGLSHGAPGDDVSVQIKTVTGDPRYRAVQDPQLEPVSMIVDGVNVEFTQWGGRDRWWAVGNVDDLALVIEGRNYPLHTVELVEIDELTPYLDGWREYMRSVRRGM